jgi:hypothetical protein
MSNKNNTEWSDRLCRVLREIAEEGVREREIIARCREIVARGIETPPDITIASECACCLVVRWQGREVLREWVEEGRTRRRFEDGPWAVAIEKIAESFEDALPVAA